MKKLLYFLLAVALPVSASDLIPYGAAFAFQGGLYTQADPPVLVASDPTFQAADCNLVRDGAAAEQCDNAPTWETTGTFAWTMSAAEATAKNITVSISDDSATAFLDYTMTFATYDNDSANHPAIGNNQLIAICVEDADSTCISLREALCVLLAEASGRADYTTGTSTWVVKDRSNTQTRLTLVYGTDDGDRSTSTYALTDC